MTDWLHGEPAVVGSSSDSSGKDRKLNRLRIASGADGGADSNADPASKPVAPICLSFCGRGRSGVVSTEPAKFLPGFNLFNPIFFHS